jgi:maltooligosyltrehalose trehalohydrolase
MTREANGYHHAILDGIEPGALYVYRLDGLIERPDPASRYQPHGPRGPSCVVDSRFAWRDRRWRGLPLTDYIIHEDSQQVAPFHDLIPGLSRLLDLGATVLSVRLDAPPHSLPSGLPYSVPLFLGGPERLKRLVDACHRRGLAVMLALSLFEPGIEADPLVSFGPYFAGRGRDRHLNLDGPFSDDVRRYFVECTLQWFREFHIDALDVGNVDGLVDLSPVPLLEELACITHAEAASIGRPLHLVACSRRNDPCLIRCREDGGIGLDALWNPDFELALQGILAHEQMHPSFDAGSVEVLKKAYLEGFVFSGQYSASRKRRHGRSSRTLPGDRFLVRFPAPAGPGQRTGAAMEEQKLIGAALFFSPFIPLLCIEGKHAVRSGSGGGIGLYPRELARLRKALRSVGLLDKQCMGVLCYKEERILLARFWKEEEDLIVLFHFGTTAAVVSLPFPSGAWVLRFDSADRRWDGPGSTLPVVVRGDGGDVALSLAPLSCAVYLRQHGG